MRYDICSVGEATPTDEAMKRSGRRHEAIAILQQHLVGLGFLPAGEFLSGHADEPTLRAFAWLMRDAQRDLVMNADELSMVGRITRERLEDPNDSIVPALAVVSSLYENFLQTPTLQQFNNDLELRAYYALHPAGTDAVVSRSGYPIAHLHHFARVPSALVVEPPTEFELLTPLQRAMQQR